MVALIGVVAPICVVAPIGAVVLFAQPFSETYFDINFQILFSGICFEKISCRSVNLFSP